MGINCNPCTSSGLAKLDQAQELIAIIYSTALVVSVHLVFEYKGSAKAGDDAPAGFEQMNLGMYLAYHVIEEDIR